MTVSEVLAALPKVLNRVTEGEEITITRHGRPVAVIVRPDILWSRSRAQDVVAEAERLNEMLREAEKAPLARGGGSGPKVGAGSVLLLPELLSKPLRDGDEEAVRTLSRFLVRLDLRTLPIWPRRSPWAPPGSLQITARTSARSLRRSTSPSPPICRESGR